MMMPPLHGGIRRIFPPGTPRADVNLPQLLLQRRERSTTTTPSSSSRRRNTIICTVIALIRFLLLLVLVMVVVVVVIKLLPLRVVPVIEPAPRSPGKAAAMQLQRTSRRSVVVVAVGSGQGKRDLGGYRRRA
jgi:hypothetical protein